MIRIEASIALIPGKGRWFLQRRDPASSMLPGLWEFPGGKLESGEDPVMALKRELAEELAWKPARILSLPEVVDLDSRRELRLHPFRCEGPGPLGTPLAWGWFTAAEIRRLPIPEANDALLGLLD
jgi:8-oxo-dGTP pyrophosphatase MutT (NUDIX family)